MTPPHFRTACLYLSVTVFLALPGCSGNQPEKPGTHSTENNSPSTEPHADSSPKTETVIVEGIGKSEASAKKAAYKEAVARVVGVLVDSTTLIKNDKIIDEELLEYSGGFVTKAELISSKTDDEGLVRVRVRCVVEQAQVRKKLESLKVFNARTVVVNVDSESLAAKEMGKADMQKNATELIEKAMNERKQVYSVVLPRDLSSVEKNIDGQYLIPAKIQIDKEKHKAWVKNWFPVFDKMAISKKSFISKLIDGGIYDSFSDADNELRIHYKNDRVNCHIKNGVIKLIIPESMTADLTIQWQHFELPFDWSKTQMFKLGKWGNLPTIEASPYAKLTLEIRGKENELLYTSFSNRFGTLDSKDNTYETNSRPLITNDTYRAMQSIFLAASIGGGASIEIPFFPCRSEYGFTSNDFYAYSRPSDRTGCIFPAKIAVADIPNISKMVATIEWIDPK